MSSTYNLEPPPTAKVLLQTTSGDIELEIFAKQTPLTSRNFLQLCLDGYYDNTIFHRLVPGFVLQGGDPTGTGDGGESIYDGAPFADEFHSRLKFNRRGLLGMANTGKKDDNGSQFFLSLGKTEELNGRNTMFGRVVGDTIYNLMKMGEADQVDIQGSERPLYPTKIIGSEVLINPFDDMVRREIRAKTAPKVRESVEKKKPKKKTGRTLLSFGVDEGEAEEPVLKKAKFNTKLVAGGDDTANLPKAPKIDATKKATKPIRRKRSRSPTPPSKTAVERQTQLPLPNEEQPSRSLSTSPEPEQVRKVSTMLERTNAQIAELKRSMRRTIESNVQEPARKKSALEQMIPENAMRGRKRKQGKEAGTTDSAALKMMSAFRAKLDAAPKESAPADEPEIDGDEAKGKEGDPVAATTQADDEEASLCDLHFIANCQSCQAWDRHGGQEAEDNGEDDKAWMSHALSFERDRLGKDLTWKRKVEEELVVIDPREKEKELKIGQRRRREHEKGRKGGTAWDMERDKGRLPERLAGMKA